jgi:hypothetical protein
MKVGILFGSEQDSVNSGLTKGAVVTVREPCIGRMARLVCFRLVIGVHRL